MKYLKFFLSLIDLSFLVLCGTWALLSIVDSEITLFMQSVIAFAAWTIAMTVVDIKNILIGGMVKGEQNER